MRAGALANLPTAARWCPRKWAAHTSEDAVVVTRQPTRRRRQPSQTPEEGFFVSESTNPRSLAIQALILDRCRALGLSRSELARRAGFKNVAKGIRRLDELCGGELQKTEWLMKGLPSALELAPRRVADALRETEKQLAEIKRRADAERRASFHPSAYLLGTETRPTQITIYGLTGGPERWRRIPLDLSQPAVTFVQQALIVVRKTPVVPFYGPTIGFVVNYSPDRAVRFDLAGNPVAMLDRAYEPGRVTLLLGGKQVSADAFAMIMGLSGPCQPPGRA